MTLQIPRIIHQIWLGPLESPAQAMLSWQEHHPGWEYKLWTEKNIPLLKNQVAFDASDDYPQKSDILRYELLENFGGVYVDADEYCLKPIDDLIAQYEKTGLIAAYEGSLDRPELVANGMMACEKGNAFMWQMVNELNVEQKGSAWEITGPQYLTRMLAEHKPDVSLLPAKHFYPIHHRDAKNRKIDLLVIGQDVDVYGVQLWNSTKRAYRPVWYKAPLKYLIYLIRKKLNKTFQVID